MLNPDWIRSLRRAVEHRIEPESISAVAGTCPFDGANVLGAGLKATRHFETSHFPRRATSRWPQ